MKPIVIVNKVDKKDSRPNEVLDEVFDLFVNLGANDDQLDFPILYASGKSGWCTKDLNEKDNLFQLLDLIVDVVPSPNTDMNQPFSM